VSEPIFHWTSENCLLDKLHLAASDSGLCKIAFGRESEAAFRTWLDRVVRPSSWVRHKTPIIEQALAEVDAYLSGELQVFHAPLDPRGTPFQRQVWAEVTAIAFGETATYREIAKRIDRPTAVRAVGGANGANPLPLFVPCHRVIGTDGALRGYGGGLELKKTLLQLEQSSLHRRCTE
jgi:O-6-methylguanine DNA methyltransferase